MNEAELLFSEVLNCDRPFLYQHRSFRLGKEKSAFISTVLKRRMQAEPLQYILGKTEFMGLEFKVSPKVLIPRPETEILVEKALKIISGRAARIMDMGTGSGCIAISLAKFSPDSKIDAVDISKDALEIARENAEKNGVKINFIQADLFNIECSRNAYDLIISNPPYVSTAEIAKLQPEIAYEPRLSLDGGRDGLEFYRRISKNAGLYLKESGLLILEIGIGQTERIKNIFQKAKTFAIIEVVKDYGGIERIIVARKEK